MNIITNDQLTACINDDGAELCSLISKKTGLEYIWQAGKEWPRHAPVLFPIVGGLRNNYYIYDGKRYALGRHGFARDKKFTVVRSAGDSLEFRLQWDEETIKVYPFKFILDIKYSLKNNSLSVEYQVSNSGDDAMYFSIGAHPAFRVPLRDDNFSDYYLQFSKNETAQRWMLSDGLIKDPVLFLSGKDSIGLSHELFSDDALVFMNLASERITLKSRKHNNGLHLDFPHSPYFGIWSAKDADFICLEPWNGIADSVDSRHELKTKMGIIRLLPLERFRCSYLITVF